MTWHNSFYIFGGSSDKRQISQVIGTKLTSIGSLSFDHFEASCDVMGKDKIFLCFNYFDRNDYKRCRMALSPLGSFTEIRQSTYEHSDANIAASECK